MSAKNESRLRRARRARARMRGLGVNRLSVHRTPRHIYAQVITPTGDRVLASASTAEAEMRQQLGAVGKGANVAAAQVIGKRIAERAKAKGVEECYFDRGGFLFHGKVKALADAAREGGLKI